MAMSSVAIEAPAGSFLSKNEVTRRVLDVLRSVKSCPTDVSVEQNFASDLKFDSMIRRDLNNKIADEFCVHVGAGESEKFVNGASVVSYITKHPKAR